jgi:HlyD family secretion protein
MTPGLDPPVLARSLSREVPRDDALDSGLERGLRGGDDRGEVQRLPRHLMIDTDVRLGSEPRPADPVRHDRAQLGRSALGATAMKGKTFWVLVLALLGGGGVLAWQAWQARLMALPPGIASGNGRVESIQVDVTTKEPGRVEKIFVKEGDMVHAGQIVAKMDTVTLEAELARAEATVAEQEAKIFEIDASIAKAASQVKLDEVEFERTRALLARNAASRTEYDLKETLVKTSEATLKGEKARLETARKSVDAAKAEATHVRSRIADMTLHSTVEGRVLYRLSEEGEVLGTGGKVLTLVNLGEVYMEIYLPAQEAAKVRIGADARIVLDILPEYAARAKVSFVAPEAQFTPKQVETRSERDKLMFRIKLSVPPERILPYIERVKTGIRGVGYVLLDDSVSWPERLDRPLPAHGLAKAGTSSSGPSDKVEPNPPTAPPKSTSPAQPSTEKESAPPAAGEAAPRS